MLPELPDAKDGYPQADRFLLTRTQTNFQNDAERQARVNKDSMIATVNILPPQTMEKYDSSWLVRARRPASAIQAAKFGKRAALIEKLEVDRGTAINTHDSSKTIRKRSCIFPGISIKASTASTIA